MSWPERLRQDAKSWPYEGAEVQKDTNVLARTSEMGRPGQDIRTCLYGSFMKEETHKCKTLKYPKQRPL